MSVGRKKGYKHTKETIEKIRKQKLGTKVSAETKQKMSLSGGHRKGKKHTKETKNKISKKRKGKCKFDKNPNWKGQNASYSAIHHWVKRVKGKPKKCMMCGSIENLQWANKNHKYKRNLSDWVSLCALCHNKFDKNNKILIS